MFVEVEECKLDLDYRLPKTDNPSFGARLSGFRLTGPIVLDALGWATDIAEDVDEYRVAEVNIRLSRMWDDLLPRFPSLFSLSRQDIVRLLALPYWQSHRRHMSMKSVPLVIDREKEIVESSLLDLNTVPYTFADKLQATQKSWLAHSPMFCYRKSGKKASIWLTTSAARLPSND